MSEAEVASLVRELYQLTARLEALFPGRRFTPDGHLVGSIGEVLAAARYGLTLSRASESGHDATTPDGRRVQIKVTQGKRVALSSAPDFLIVLKLLPSGDLAEVYSGPGGIPWDACGLLQKNGQRPLSLAKLQRLMRDVPPEARVLVLAT